MISPRVLCTLREAQNLGGAWLLSYPEKVGRRHSSDGNYPHPAREWRTLPRPDPLHITLTQGVYSNLTAISVQVPLLLFLLMFPQVWCDSLSLSGTTKHS